MPPSSNFLFSYRYLSDKWRLFLTYFLNLRCLECKKQSTSPLCRQCANEQKSFSHRCQTCLNITSQYICLTCQNNPPALDALIVRWRYRDNVRTWIQKAKFSADRVAIQILREEAEYLAQTLTTGDFEVIMPMPIPQRRLAQRGFNQTLFLARGVAKVTGRPLLTGLLSRHYRPQQVKMDSPLARKKNIQDAFFLSGRPPEKILLVDDVCTTGATLSEAANTLKAGGAKWIGALVIAGK